LRYKDALEIANELCNEQNGKLIQHFTQWVVCGSIRRVKEFVNDIDIVAIQKSESEYNFGEISLEDHIKALDPGGSQIAKSMDKSGAKRFLNGSKIKRFRYREIIIDLYLADEKTFETIKLVRTGSTKHNIRLVKLARQKGLKLKVSGKGLCKIKGGIYNSEPEEIIEIVENTEDGILQYLLGRIPAPEERRI